MAKYTADDIKKIYEQSLPKITKAPYQNPQTVNKEDIKLPNANKENKLISFAKTAGYRTAADTTNAIDAATFLRQYDMANNAQALNQKLEEERQTNQRISELANEKGTNTIIPVNEKQQILADLGSKININNLKNQSDLTKTLQQKALQSETNLKQNNGAVANTLIDIGLAGTDVLGKIAIEKITGIPIALQYGITSGADRLQQDINNGKSIDMAIKSGIGSGVITGGIESLTGIGAAKLSKTMASKAGQKLLAKVPQGIANYLSKINNTTIAKILKNAAGEGLEEAIEYDVQRVYQNLLYDENTPRDIKEQAYNTLIGAGVGGLFGGANTLANNFIEKQTNNTLPTKSQTNKVKVEDIIKNNKEVAQEANNTQATIPVDETVNNNPVEVELTNEDLIGNLFEELGKDSPDPEAVKNIINNKSFEDRQGFIESEANPFPDYDFNKGYNEPVIEPTTNVNTQVEQIVDNDINNAQTENKDVKSYGIQQDQDSEILRTNNNKTYDALDRLGKSVGVKIKVVKSDVDFNGYYDGKTNTLQIALDSQNPLMAVAKHEFTHKLQTSTPELYNNYKSFVLNTMKKNKTYQNKFNDLVEAYKKRNIPYDNNLIEDEIVAKTTEDIFKDRDTIAEMVNYDPTLAEKIVAIIKDVINKIKKVTNSNDLTLRELQKAEKLWSEMLNSAIKSNTQTETMTQDNVTYSDISPDIRFSLKEPVEETKDLIAVHNIGEDQLKGVLELGGFPVPSIAIIKAEQGHFKFGEISVIFKKDTISPTNRLNKVFGSDVYSKRFPYVNYKLNSKVIDRIKNKIYSLTDADMRNAYIASIDETNITNRLQTSKSSGDFVKGYNDEPIFKAAYLKDKGIAFKPVMKQKTYGRWETDLLEKIRKYLGDEEALIKFRNLDDTMKLEPEIRNIINKYWTSKVKDKALLDVVTYKEEMGFGKLDDLLNQLSKYTRDDGNNKEIDYYKTKEKLNKVTPKKAFEQWLAELSKGIIEKKGVRNDKDPFSPSGNRRTFEQLNNPYVLDEIVNLMKGDIKGTEGFMYGLGNVRAGMTKEFKSIQEIKENKNKLATSDEFMEIKENTSNEYYKLSEDFAKYHRHMSGASDAFDNTMFETAKKGKITPTAFKAELKLDGYEVNDIPEFMIKQALDFLNSLKDMPTEYFEAKPQRAVGLNEIAAVVAPKTTNKDLLQQLKDRNIKVVKYDAKVDGDRLVKVNSIEGVRFSLKTNEDDTSAVRRLGRELSKNYSSKYDKQELENKLFDLYKSVETEDALNKAKDIATKMIERSKEINNLMYNEYSQLRKTLKVTAIFISDKDKGDFNVAGGYNEFRKRNFGRLNLTKDGMSIDTFYQEIADTYPELFSKEVTNPADQAMRISDVLDGLKAEEVNPYANNQAEAIDELTNEIIKNLKLIKDKAEKFVKPQNKEIKNVKKNNNKLPKASQLTILLDAEERLNQAQSNNASDKRIANVLTSSKPNKLPVKSQLTNIKDAFNRKFVDSGNTIATVAKLIKDSTLYTMYNNARQARQAAEFMLTEAQTDVLGKNVGKSLIKIFEPIRRKGDDYYRSFSEYMYHKHNISRMAQEKPVFGDSITADVSRAKVAEYELSNPEFVDYANEIYNYNRNLMQYRVDTGLISEKQAIIMNSIYPFYVPTYRDVSGIAGSSARGNTVEIKQGIKKATGSSRDLLPLHEQMARMTMQVVQAGKRNMFGNRLLSDVLANKDKLRDYIQSVETNKVEDQIDIDELDAMEMPELNNTFIVYNDGQKIAMRVNAGVFEAVKIISSQGREVTGIELGAKWLNSVFKKMITSYSPLFTIRNIARDIQDAGLYSKDLNAFIKSYPKAMAEIKNNGELWQTYQALGGFGSSIFDYERGYLLKERKKALTKAAGAVLDKIEDINFVTEQLPRFAEFMATVEKGDGSYENLMEAMYNAADITVNFGRSGTWGRVLNTTFVPFFNPSVQGIDKLIRTFTEAKGAKAWTSLVIKSVALGVLPSVLNALLYDDDDEYDKLNDRDKDTNFLFKVNKDQWLKIPKGRVLSLFGNAAQRTLRSAKGEKDAWAEFLSTTADSVAPVNPFTENIVAPLILAANNKTWYGTPIENQSLQNVKPADRYDENTDSFSIMLGKALNYSPKKINYLLDSYSGVIGDFVLPMMTKKAESNPVTKAFVIDSTLSNKISKNFYNAFDEVKYAKNAAEADSADDVIYRFMNKQSQAVSDLNKEMRTIENGNLKDNEKRVKVKEIKATMNALEQNALDSLEKYKETATKNFSKYKDVDDAYLYTNKEVFGAEYAIRVYNKKTYEKYLKSGKSAEKFFKEEFEGASEDGKIKLPTIKTTTSNVKLPTIKNK